jgi:hypothetical protein
MDTLKFPLEYGTEGFKKITDGTDEYYKQLLSMASLTEPGISPIFPNFGVFDPTFNMADKGQFLITAAKYVPEVQILNIENTVTNDGGSAIRFNFVRR